MTVVLVTGSRNWRDATMIHRAMEHEGRVGRQPMTLIHGDCPSGADSIAARHAERLGWAIVPYPANWRVQVGTPPWAVRTRADGERYSVLGGIERNDRMLETHPDVVLGFNRGGSPGTSDCVGKARKLGIRVVAFNARIDEESEYHHRPLRTVRSNKRKSPRTEEEVRGLWDEELRQDRS